VTQPSTFATGAWIATAGIDLLSIRGAGRAIVEALLAKVREVPYANVLVEALPLPGLEAFYASFGFQAARRHAPGMHLWLNDSGA